MAGITPYEELWDMPFDPKVCADEQHVPRWFVNVAGRIVKVLIRILWRFKAYGLENLRSCEGKSGAIIAGNHSSFLDPVFVILSALYKQWPRFMAKDSMFKNAGGVAGFILGRAGVIPIKRDSADREGIKRGVHHLKHGEVICIFPEGTRRGKTDYPISLHTGAAFMARMANVPIIPCGITGAGKICPGKGIHFPRVSVTYGKPVCESDFSMFPRNDRLDAMTWYVMREVHALAEGIAPEEVDMDGLYPGSRNFSAEFVGFVPASWAEEGEEAAGAHHMKDNDA